jgi:hypothetical protein
VNAAYSDVTTDEAFSAARMQMDTMVSHLQSPVSMKSTHAEIGAYAEKEGREMTRRLVQAHFDVRSAREHAVPVRGHDGVLRTYRRASRRALLTVVGPVQVPRIAYQAADVDARHPMDSALNLPVEHYSHGVRRLVAEKAARHSFEEVVCDLGKATGAPVKKRQVEELTVRAARDFEAFYQQRRAEPESVEKTSDLLILSFDGKGIVMRPQDLRPATKKKAAGATRKLSTRLTKGEKRNRKRMAEVAVVYTVAKWPRTPLDILHELRPLRDVSRPRPIVRNKRVWASVEQSIDVVVGDAFADAFARDPEQKRRWVVLLDGNKDQLAAVTKTARRTGAQVTIVVDLIHVLEYLWKAAHALHGDGTKKAETFVQTRLMHLLQGRKSGRMASELRQRARVARLDSDRLLKVIDAADYLQKYAPYLRYADALREGLPIATGVIEGACRYLVKDRMDRTGARWSLVGAESVLRLRAIVASNDFEAYWDFHIKSEYGRNHRARYADGLVPDPISPLRRLK